MAYPSKHNDEIENVFGSLRHLKIDGYEFILFLVNSGFQRPKTNFLRNQSNLASKSKRAEEKIFKALNALDLVQDVTMVPMQIPWRTVLSSGDVFINPMPNCSFNSLLLEAMSIGAAVVSASGGVDDLIIEDQTAVILEMNDELSIMRSLQKLLDRHEFAQKIAQNAQDYVKKHHSVSNMISDILQIYHETES
jgi:glycosyltransferase involved in cell wall biosynthesis